MSIKKKPHEQGMRKGELYSGARSRARQYKQTVIAYMRKHLDLENISSVQRKLMAEKYALSEATISDYLKEAASLNQSLATSSAQYPLPIALFSEACQNKPYLEFNQILQMRIDTREYQMKSLSAGEYTMRLNFKLKGKSPNTIELYFQDCQTGEKYKIVMFGADDTFKPRNGHIDFGGSYLNGQFVEFSLYINQSGYPVISEASLI